MMKGRFVLGVLVLWCLFALVAHGAPIVVYNTGTGLAAGVQDPHYWIFSKPGGGSGNLYVTLTGGYPFPPWHANLPSAQWIAPSQTGYQGNESDAPGAYIFRTTFDLTGLNPHSAQLTLSFASDDCTSGIFLNSVDTGIYSSSPGCLANLHTFTITGGFQQGLNYLDFHVDNGSALTHNPTGLLVSISGTADVPEPATLTLLGCGLAGFLLLRRRNRKA